MPLVSRSQAVSDAAVTGVMRSTMVLGKAVSPSIQRVEVGVLEGGEVQHGLTEDVAIMLDVVAGEQRRRGAAVGAATA